MQENAPGCKHSPPVWNLNPAGDDASQTEHQHCLIFRTITFAPEPADHPFIIMLLPLSCEGGFEGNTHEQLVCNICNLINEARKRSRKICD